ncbi:hypothetical protein OKW28_007560 [Paraburkholderia sp. 40]
MTHRQAASISRHLNLSEQLSNAFAASCGAFGRALREFSRADVRSRNVDAQARPAIRVSRSRILAATGTAVRQGPTGSPRPVPGRSATCRTAAGRRPAHRQHAFAARQTLHRRHHSAARTFFHAMYLIVRTMARHRCTELRIDRYSDRVSLEMQHVSIGRNAVAKQHREKKDIKMPQHPQDFPEVA